MSTSKYNCRTENAAQAPGNQQRPTSTTANSANQRNWFLRVEHRLRVRREYGKRLGYAGLGVYEVLGLYANSMTGKTFISRRTICELAHLGPNAVQQAISALVQAGLITIAVTRGTVPTLYTLLPLPESCEGLLPFDQPVVPTQYHKPPASVVLDQPSSGTGKGQQRYQTGMRNKDERTVNEPLTNSLGESESKFDVQVHEIGHLHPKNSKLKRNFLPSDQERAIVDAIVRDGYDLVLAGTIAMRDAVSHWPPWEQRFMPNPVKFYRDAEYLQDPSFWERGHEQQPVNNAHVARTLNNLSAAERAIQRQRERRQGRGDNRGAN